MTAVNFTYTADATQYQQTLGEMITATSNMGSASKTLVGTIAQVGVAATRMAANLVTANRAYNGATAMAAAYEQKLSKVEAATVVANKSFAGISRQMREMARDMPGGIDMATQQVQALQQMGVTSEKNLVPLARAMTQIGAATGELSPALSQANMALAKTFGSTSTQQITKWGDSLVAVKSQAGASAESITSFANAIAPLSKTLGMTQSQVTGFSGAFAAAGQDGYLAANTFNKMISDMERAAREGTGGLQVYADTVGMTSKAFSDLVKSSPTEAVLKMFDALGKGGTDSLRTLERLGLDAPRTMKTIQAVAQQGNLRATVETAMGSYGSGVTGKGAEAAFGGMNDELARSQEIMQQLAASAGQPLLGPMTEVTKLVNDLGSGFAGLAQNDVIQKATGALILFGGALGTVAKAYAAMATAGGVKGLLSLGGVRQGAAATAGWLDENRKMLMLGGLGAMGAGAAMDNNMMLTAGTLGLLASNFAPGGTLGKGLDVARKGAAAGIGMLYLDSYVRQQQGFSDLFAGKSPYSQTTQDLAKATGIKESKLLRMFGADEAAMRTALGHSALAGQGLTGAAKIEAAAAATAALAPAEGAAVRAGLRGAGVQGAKAIGMTAAGVLGAAGPALLPMAGIAAAAGGGLFAYSQAKQAGEMTKLALDEGTSSARKLSEQYGIALEPLAKFSNELVRATESITTWGDAVEFSADRRKAAEELRATGAGGQKLTIGKNASYEEALAQVIAGGGMISPQMLAALTNDVAAQRGVDFAERISADVDRMRANPQEWLRFTTAQISSDAERGWQAPFVSGYSGKRENIEMAAGTADVMRTEIERLQGIGGTRKVGEYKQQQLKVVEEQMMQALKDGTMDRDVFTSLLAPLVGEENARAYVDEFVGNQGGASINPLIANPIFKPFVDAYNKARTGSSTMDTAKSDINKLASEPVSAPTLEDIRNLGSSRASRLTTRALATANSLGLSPDELDDLMRNGSRSQAFGKVKGQLGLSDGASTDQVLGALEGNLGFGAAERQALTAFRLPQNQLVQTTAAMNAVRTGSGNPMLERQRIMEELLSGKPMDASHRESLQAQLAAIDQFMLPAQMGQMTSTQQRKMTSAAARQTLAWAQANPENEEAQAAGMQASATLEANRAAEEQYLKQRAQQAFEFQKSTGRAWEDYYIGVGRAQEDFQISSARAEEEFGIQRERMLEEFNINIRRSQEDHDLQMTRMAEDTAKGMISPFQRWQPEQMWGLGSIAANVTDQVKVIEDQVKVLEDLRKRGLTQQAIDTLGLADPANARKVAAMVNSTRSEIRAANKAARRAGEAGEDVRDEQVSTRRFEEDYVKGLKRGREDLNRTLRNSEADFRRSMRNSRADFQRTLSRQSEDMNRQMARQLQDFRDMDKEFVGDKKTLMKQIKTVMSGGMGEWDGIAKQAMDDVGGKAKKGWGNIESDSKVSIDYLYDIWKNFGVDGKPPSGRGPSSSKSTGTGTGKTPGKSTAPASTNPGKAGDGPRNPGTRPDKTPPGRGQRGAGPGVVSKAGDGEDDLWESMGKRFDKLQDVIKEYGWLGIAGTAGFDTSLVGAASAGGNTANAKWIYKQLLADGYSPQQAAGILGNLQQESGFNPRAAQSGGPGRGLVQWSEGGRWNQLQAWASRNNMDPWSLDAQYLFMRKEMSDGWGGYSDAAFRKIDGVQAAASYFGNNYEVYGDAGDRYAYAAAWFEKLGKSGFAGASAAGQADATKGMGIWEIGDAIFRAGKAAEEAAATSSGPGYAPKFIGGVRVGTGEDIGPVAAVIPFTQNNNGTFYSAADGSPNRSNPHSVGWRGQPNWGVNDIGGSGYPVYAYAYGKVMHAGPFGDGDYSPGSTVDIIHLNKGWTRYAHLGTVKVQVGDIVDAGDKIGVSGSDHLHFEWTGMPSLTQREGRGSKVPWLARGGIVTQAQMAMIGEAGHEAVIPLNTRGVDMLAAAIGRYSVSYEARKARAMQHGTPVTTATTVHHEDHSTQFNGPISVRAEDPAQFIRRMDEEKRRRNLVGGSRR